MYRTEDSGHPIDIRYVGVITMTPDVKKIFTFQPDMKTVPFGFSSMLILNFLHHRPRLHNLNYFLPSNQYEAMRLCTSAKLQGLTTSFFTFSRFQYLYCRGPKAQDSGGQHLL